MIKLFVQRYITTQLKQWLVVPDNQLAFKDGCLELHNVEISSELKKHLQLTVEIDYSAIQTFSIQLPERFDEGNKLTISLKGLHISAVLKNSQTETKACQMQRLNHLMQQASESRVNLIKNKLVSNLVRDRLLRLVEFRTESVHIRVESEGQSAIGIMLSQLTACNDTVSSLANEDKFQNSAMSKKFSMTNLRVYCDLDDFSSLCILPTEQKSQKFVQIEEQLLSDKTALEKLILRPVSLTMNYSMTRSIDIPLRQSHSLALRTSDTSFNFSHRALNMLSKLSKASSSSIDLQDDLSIENAEEFEMHLKVLLDKLRDESGSVILSPAILQEKVSVEELESFSELLLRTPDQLAITSINKVEQSSNPQMNATSLAPSFFLLLVQDKSENSELEKATTEMLKESKSSSRFLDHINATKDSTTTHEASVKIEATRTTITYEGADKQDSIRLVNDKITLEYSSRKESSLGVSIDSILLSNSPSISCGTNSEKSSYQVNISKCIFNCKQLQQVYEVSFTIQSVAMERLVNDKSTLIVKSLQEFHPSTEVTECVQLSARVCPLNSQIHSPYIVQAFNAQLQDISIEDIESLVSALRTIQKEYETFFDSAPNTFRKWKEKILHAEIVLTNSRVIARLSEVDVALHIGQSSIQRTDKMYEAVGGKMNLLIRSEASSNIFRQASNTFQVQLNYEEQDATSQKLDCEYSHLEITASAIKLSVQKQEQLALARFVQQCIFGTREQMKLLAAMPNFNLRFKLESQVVELVTYDERGYPLIKSHFDQAYVSGRWNEDKSFNIIFKIADFYVSFFEEFNQPEQYELKPSSSILESRIIGKLTKPKLYMLNGKDKQLSQVLNVGYESEIEPANLGLMHDTSEDSSKLIISYEFDASKIKLSLKLREIDTLLTADALIRNLDFGKTDKLPQTSISDFTSTSPLTDWSLSFLNEEYITLLENRTQKPFIFAFRVDKCNVYIPSRYKIHGNENKVIGCKGDMSFLVYDSLHRDKELTTTPGIDKSKSAEGKKFSELHTKMTWNISNFEVFITDIREILHQNKEIKPRSRRQIILPAALMFSLDGILRKFPHENQPLHTNIKCHLSLQRLNLQFSNEDILIISETIKGEWQAFIALNKELYNSRITSGKLLLIFNELYFSFAKRQVDINIEIAEVLLKTLNKDWSPLFHLVFNTEQCRLQNIDNVLQGVFRFVTKCSYFNSSVGCWEPFLEKTALMITYERNGFKDGEEQLTISSQFEEDPTSTEASNPLIEVCITDIMVQMLLDNRKFLENIASALSPELQIQAANTNEEPSKIAAENYSYEVVVENYSGYEVELEFYERMIEEDQKSKATAAKSSRSNSRVYQKTKVLRDQELTISSIPYIQALAEEELSSALRKQRPVNMSIKLKDKDGQLLSRRDINAESFSMRKFSLKNESGAQEAKREIYVSIGADSHYKLIALYSRVTLENNLTRSVWVHLENEETEYSIELKPEMLMGISEEFLRGKIGFKFDQYDDVWFHNWKLQSLLESEPGVVNCIKNENELEYYSLCRSRDPNDKLKQVFYICKQIEITNALPIPIKLAYQISKTSIEVDSQEDFLTLSPGEVFSFQQLDTKRKFELTFKINKLEWLPWLELQAFNGPKALTTLGFKDCHGNTVNINVRYNNDCNSPHFSLYCDYCVLDHSGLGLRLMKSLDSKETRLATLPGDWESKEQDEDGDDLPDMKCYIVNVEDLRKLVLVKDGHTEYPTDNLPIGLLGKTRSLIWIRDQNEPALDRTIDLTLKTKKLLIGTAETKCTFVTPSYIFINKTSYNLSVSQSSRLDTIVEVKPQERRAVEWIGEHQTKGRCQINIASSDADSDDSEGSQLQYLSSAKIDLLSEESTDFVLRSTKKTDYKILNITMDKKGASSYIVLQERLKEDSLLKIENTLEDFDLIVYQSSVDKSCAFSVPRGETINFAWDSPLLKKELQIDFIDANQKHYHDRYHRFDFDKLEMPQESALELKDSKRLKFRCDVVLRGNAKVLTVFEVKINAKVVNRYSRSDENNDKQHHRVRRLMIALNHIGFSFVTEINGWRMELFYASFINFGLALNEKAGMQECQMRVKFVNIDTNHAVQATYPVLLTASNFESILESDQHTVDISFLREKSASQTKMECFHYFKMLIQPLIFKIDSDTLELLVEYSHKWERYFSSYSKQDELCSVQNIIEGRLPILLMDVLQQRDLSELFDWKLKSVSGVLTNATVHFHNFEIDPLFVWFAFTKGPTAVTEDEAQTLWSASLNAAPPIENLVLSLKGLRMTHFYDGVDKIFMQFRKMYSEELTMPFLGWIHPVFTTENPDHYFKGRAWKTELLLEKTTTKLLKGPLQDIDHQKKAYKEGTVKHSMSRNFSTLTLDEETLFERQADLAVQPSNLLQGLNQGGRVFLKNIGRGITSNYNNTQQLTLLLDLVVKPISESQKSGLPGFFKGVIKGVGGAIASPFYGAYDATSKALQGLKNTANIFGKSANGARLRNPRVFYETRRQLKEYDASASLAFSTINQTEKDSFYEDLVVLHVSRLISDSSAVHLFMAMEYIMLINCSKERILWKIKPEWIKMIALKQKEVEIHLHSDSHNKFENKTTLTLTAKTPSDAMLLAQKLEDCRKVV